MKNVKRCSISGIAFTMDADAYETLSEYVDSLRASCGTTPDGDEIVADIEARIAELILSTCSAESVVEKPLIENIIRQMGRPEDISSEAGSADSDTETDSDGTSVSDSDASAEPRIPRRLYRDMENAKLGGVCAGLAKYFGTDPVWVRLLFVVPLLLTPMSGMVRFFGPLFGNMFGMFVLAYVVMWFAVPAARSARQKLEMNGERITARSIKDTTVAGAAAGAPSGSAADADSEAKPVVANVVTAFGKILLILLKILAGIIVFGLILTACALIIGMLVVIISGEGVKDYSVMVASLGISVVLLPVMLLIYVLMCLIASRKPGPKSVAAMFIIWIALIVALIAAALYDCNFYGNRSHRGLHHRSASVTLSESGGDEQTADEDSHQSAMQPAEVVDIIDVSDTAAEAAAEAAESAAEAAASSEAKASSVRESRPVVQLTASDGTEDVQISFDADSAGFTIRATKSDR